MSNIVIVGSGPAGVSAALYAVRAGVQTTVLTKGSGALARAGRGAMLHCFCETPADWQTLELIYQPDFAAGQTVHFVVRRDADEVHLGAVPATLAEVGSVVDL